MRDWSQRFIFASTLSNSLKAKLAIRFVLPSCDIGSRSWVPVVLHVRPHARVRSFTACQNLYRPTCIPIRLSV